MPRPKKPSCPLGYDHLQLPYLQDACRSAGFEDNRKVRTHGLHWEWHKFIASSQNWSDGWQRDLTTKSPWSTKLGRPNFNDQPNSICYSVGLPNLLTFLGYLFVILFFLKSQNHQNFNCFLIVWVCNFAQHRLHGTHGGELRGLAAWSGTHRDMKHGGHHQNTNAGFATWPETTLKDGRNPTSLRDNTRQSSGLIFPCNKVLMVDPETTQQFFSGWCAWTSPSLRFFSDHFQ